MLCALILALVAADPAVGPWSAWLDSPGGRLPFELELNSKNGILAGAVTNGRERIDVPITRGKAGEVTFEFPQYDARIEATLDAAGTRLDGAWSKRAGPDLYRRLPFHATANPTREGSTPTAPPSGFPDVSGRWSLTFAKDPERAVAILDSKAGRVEGTVLTATGDLRYLAGSYTDHMVLTCFDGAHAFLFTADLQPDGSLKGGYFAGDSWSDTWTATRDDKAQLSDEMSHAHWNDAFGLAELQYPDFAGQLVSLADARFTGQVRVLQLTGSWCPNCQDETALLVELDKAYRAKGLAITALCFEVTGERARDTTMAQRMLERHGATYLGLLAGRSDKSISSQSLPALDRVFAFPTTVFLHRDGRVRAVHSGFSGPATGAAHAALRAEFTRIIEELLAEPAPKVAPCQSIVANELWRDERERALVHFTTHANGSVNYTSTALVQFGAPPATEPIETGAATFDGDTVHLGKLIWHYDSRAHVMLDPSDCSHRMTPGARSPFPVVDAKPFSQLPQIVEGLASTDATRRRESAYYLALQLVADRMTPKEYGGGRLDQALAAGIAPLVDDADPKVRAQACWSASVTGLDAALPALVKNLEHGFAPVRREAARALGLFQYKPALDALTKLARDDIDPLVRGAAEASCTALRGQ